MKIDLLGSVIPLIALVVLPILGFMVYLHFRNRRLVSRLENELRLKDLMVADLTSSSAQLRAGIDGLGAALWDWNLQTRELYVSDLFLEMTGYRRAEFTTNMARILSFIHPEDVAETRSIVADYLEGKLARCSFEMRMLFQDGHYHWVHVSALVTRDEVDRPLRIVGSISDVSEKVLAEEERDRLFNLSVDMLAVGGFDGSFHQLNPAWVRVLGWSRDEILGNSLLSFIHPADSEVIQGAMKTLENGEPATDVESRFRCRDGNYRWLSWSSYPYPDQELIFSVVRDVTDKKAAQEQVLEYQDRLRSLGHQLALVEDRQRQDLATALHDGLAQQLFAIRAKVTLLKYPDKLKDYAAEIEETLGILDETMSDARNLSFELFPPVLHEVGLEAALTWLAHQFNLRTGVECSVSCEGAGAELPEDLRAMAYQSIRELLNNVYKHAEATEVSISLNHVDDFLTLLVDDNGVGFEIDQEREARARQESGFGLFSIRERLRSLGGRLLVDSQPGQGCRVFLTIPREP